MVGVTAADNLLVPWTDFDAFSAAVEANLGVPYETFKGTAVNLNRMMTVVTFASKLSYEDVGSNCSAASIH